MNILFLGGAKRVSMARMFKDAYRRLAPACGLSPDVSLFSYEMSASVPIVQEAEVVIGLRWTHPDVCRDIASLCRSRGIGLVVPFVDGAVAVAASVSEACPGTVFAPTGSAALAEAMFDKVRAAALFEHAALPAPATFRPGVDSFPSFPLIAKPRCGSASKGIVFVDSKADLGRIAPGEFLVQRRFDRRREYTVDCYASVADGRRLAVSPRLRIEVSGGEVTRTATVARPDIASLASDAVVRLGLRGAVTVQVIEDLDTGRIMLMEINPRLGGGAVCSVHAGADIPALVVAEALGLSPQPLTAAPGVEIVRYPQEVVLSAR